ncbi:hypothetical protein GCM10028818_43210 [Spirosoma horti]
MIQENDLVVLLTDLPTVSLRRGDVGTIAHVYQSGTRYEVEFVNAKGDTIAVETLTVDQIKKVDESRAILHYIDVERAA